MAKKKVVRVKLVRSPIGYSQRQKRTAQALGLKKINQTVEHPDNPQIRGMINRILHLVEVEE